MNLVVHCQVFCGSKCDSLHICSDISRILPDEQQRNRKAEFIACPNSHRHAHNGFSTVSRRCSSVSRPHWQRWKLTLAMAQSVFHVQQVLQPGKRSSCFVYSWISLSFPFSRAFILKYAQKIEPLSCRRYLKV